jgi:hypothetical protein
MIVKCINNVNRYHVLTIDKLYEVESYDGYYYKIKNDKDFIRDYFSYRFINIQEERKLKLLKINEKR